MTMLRLWRVTVVLVLTAAALPENGAAQSGSSDPLAFLKEGLYRPYIDAGAGVGLLSHAEFGGTLPQLGTAFLRFGYRELKPYKSRWVKLDDRFLVGGYGSTDFPLGRTGTDSLSAELWTLGVGHKTGYGYDLGFLRLVPHHQLTFGATKLQPQSFSSLSPQDSAIIGRYYYNTHLSIGTEAGISTMMFGFLGVHGGFESSVIYPKVVFAEWITSYVLAAGAIVLVTEFSEDIVALSPTLGPIIYFLLRNAVAYGFMYAFSRNQNWPFPSEVPMMNNVVRVNVGFQF
jgi:hypothetical protein